MLAAEPAKAPVDGGESDAALAGLWRDGDAGAAERLIRRHLPGLLAFARSRLGGGGLDAEDVVQEAFAAASRHIAGFRHEGDFKAWLYGIARNKVTDVWRRHRPSEPFEPAHEPVEERTPAAIHAEAEDAEEIWKRVTRLLPEQQATALWLRVREDATMEAIAAALETTPAHVRILLFRARQTLARHWKNQSPITNR